MSKVSEEQMREELEDYLKLNPNASDEELKQRYIQELEGRQAQRHEFKEAEDDGYK